MIYKQIYHCVLLEHLFNVINLYGLLLVFFVRIDFFFGFQDMVSNNFIKSIITTKYILIIHPNLVPREITLDSAVFQMFVVYFFFKKRRGKDRTKRFARQSYALVYGLCLPENVQATTLSYALVYGLCSGIWTMLWYMDYALVYGLCSGIWTMLWYMDYALVYGLCSGIWTMLWYMDYALVYGLCSGIWTMLWYMDYVYPRMCKPQP